MRPYYEDERVTLWQGDNREILRQLPAASVQCVVTSPPFYHLRDYGVDGQIGLEPTLPEYIAQLVAVFAGVRHVLRDDGVLFVELGDCYSGGRGGGWKGDEHGQQKKVPITDLGPKQLMGVPWRFAFAMQDAGWILREEIVWHKPNVMPESVQDRCTRAHSTIFHFAKQERYYWDNEAIKEPAGDWHGSNFDDPRDVQIHPTVGRKPRQSVPRGGFNGKTNALPGREAFRAVTPTRNRRSVWTVATQPYKESHFACWPERLVEPMILAGSRESDVVLDPFAGSFTTGQVAVKHRRRAIGIEMNADYCAMSVRRFGRTQVALPMEACP